MNGNRLPNGLRFWNPSTIISTWFGSGLLPWAPGTWGSLATLPFAWVVSFHWGVPGMIIATFALFLIGIWSTQKYLRFSSEPDPQTIVIDEVVGQFISLIFLPTEIFWFLAAFILFRIADITKPWPASWADRSLKGALGIMADDIFAGVYVLGFLSIIYATIC